MDEREVHELLRGAAENVQPSHDLAERAERRYRTRRVRGRVLATAVVIALIGSGIATAQMVRSDGEAPKVVAPTTMPRPVRPVAPNELVSLAFVDANTGYGVGGNGLEPALAKTEDGGRTWRAVGHMPANATEISIVSGHSASEPSLLAWGSGLYVSSDDGSHWRRTRSESIEQVAVASGRVWVTTFCATRAPCNEAVTFSDDGGRSWKDAALRQPAAGGATLVAATRDVVYVAKAGPSGGVIAKTADGGDHWTSEPAPCPAFNESASLALNDRVLLLACVGLPNGQTPKAVFLSSDGGRTWEGGGNLFGFGASVVAFRSSFLANTGRSGLFASTDDGRSWRGALANDAALSINVLRGVGVWVILFGENNGIWFSADGIHWEQRAGG